MKVERGEIIPQSEPVTITLESDDEVRAFFHMVNFCPTEEQMKGYLETYKTTYKEVDAMASKIHRAMDALGLREPW